MLTEYPDWTYNKGQVYVVNQMTKPEPLSIQYGLTYWLDPHYSYGDLRGARPIAPALKDKYTGVYLRVKNPAQTAVTALNPYVPKTA